MVKKLTRGALAVVLGVALLAGCGDTAGDSTTDDQREGPAGSPAVINPAFDTTPGAAPSPQMGDDVPPDSPMATDEPADQQQQQQMPQSR